MCGREGGKKKKLGEMSGLTTTKPLPPTVKLSRHRQGFQQWVDLLLNLLVSS